MDLPEVKVETEPGLDFSELAVHIKNVAQGKAWIPRPSYIEHSHGGGHGPGCSKEQVFERSRAGSLASIANTPKKTPPVELHQLCNPQKRADKCDAYKKCHNSPAKWIQMAKRKPGSVHSKYWGTQILNH